MTYRDLIHKLLDMTDTQLNCDVTIVLPSEEVFRARLNVTDESWDVLDPNHPIIEFDVEPLSVSTTCQCACCQAARENETSNTRSL